MSTTTASAAPSRIDRSKPLFPDCLASAINDGYEVAFIGIIEFLERALEDHHHQQQQQQQQESRGADAVAAVASATGGNSGNGRYYKPHEGDDPLNSSNSTNSNSRSRDGGSDDSVYSAEALHALITTTDTLPIVPSTERKGDDGTGGSPCDYYEVAHGPFSPSPSASDRASPTSTDSPTRSSLISRCHMGISFNAGKDSMVMLHLVLNAMEHLVEVGDWVCGTHNAANAAKHDDADGQEEGEASRADVEEEKRRPSSVSLIRPHHMRRFQQWRSVFVGGGPDATLSKSIPNPCQSPLLSFLFSHLCIFYFEDRDEIPLMKDFLGSLLQGLDLPVFAMDKLGGLRRCGEGTLMEASPPHLAQEEVVAGEVGADSASLVSISIATGASSGNHHNSNAAADGSNAAWCTASQCVGGSIPHKCHRFHSRSHHADCLLSSGALRSPVSRGAVSSSTSAVNSSTATAARGNAPSFPPCPSPATAHHANKAASLPASSLSLPALNPAGGGGGLSPSSPSSPNNNTLAYRGAKVICVSEGAGGMSDGLRLLKKHFHCHFAFLGVRCEDIVGWRQDPIEMTSKGWPELLRLCPIFGWSYSQVWMYLFYYNVPFSTLYSMGISSCGPSARTVRNPSCIVRLKRGKGQQKQGATARAPSGSSEGGAEIGVDHDAGAAWLLGHPNNCFDPKKGHCVHPNDPHRNAALAATAEGDAAQKDVVSTTSPPPAPVVITIDSMWPAVCGGGVVGDGESLSSAHNLLLTRGPSSDKDAAADGTKGADIYACWDYWWAGRLAERDRKGSSGRVVETSSNANRRPPLLSPVGDGGGADDAARPFPLVVTAAWDPTDIDLNAGHLHPCVESLARGPYDPHAISGCGALLLSAAGPEGVKDAEGDADAEDGSFYYAVPAWLLREGSLERASRLPAPRQRGK